MSSTTGPSGRGSSLDELLRRLLELTQALPSGDASSADVDLVLEEIEDEVASRSLDAVYPEIFVEVTRLPARHGVSTRTLLTITGLSADGDPEPLAYASGFTGATHLAARLFRDLALRGVGHVERVLAEARPGIADVASTVFPDADWVELASGERPPWLELGAE